MDPGEWNTAISLAVGVITLLGLLWGLWLKFRRRLRAVWGRFSALFGALEQVQAVLTPNGGSSLPDKIDALTKQSHERSVELRAHGEQIGLIGRKVDGISNTMRAMQNVNTRTATFECDAQGMCVYVNRTYLRWVGLTFEEVKNWGWLNALYPDDKEFVLKTWTTAVADSRRFQERYRMRHSDGSVFYVDGSAEPIPEGVIPAERWLGQLIKLETEKPI